MQLRDQVFFLQIITSLIKETRSMDGGNETTTGINYYKCYQHYSTVSH